LLDASFTDIGHGRPPFGDKKNQWGDDAASPPRGVPWAGGLVCSPAKSAVSPPSRVVFRFPLRSVAPPRGRRVLVGMPFGESPTQRPPSHISHGGPLLPCCASPSLFRRARACVRNCIFPWAGREGCVNFDGAYHGVCYCCLGWNAAQRPTNSVSSAGRLDGRALIAARLRRASARRVTSAALATYRRHRDASRRRQPCEARNGKVCGHAAREPKETKT
jgi:hypothetical protein